MDTASSAGPDLEQVVRKELTDAGFAVAPSLMSADGGLGVWHDPDRGVVVSWGSAFARRPVNRLVGYQTIRTAVQLALRTILADAGHQVREDRSGTELIITS